MMSRKDYERAALIAGLHADPGARTVAIAVFVALFTGDNPRFSPTRFRERVHEHAERHDRVVTLSRTAP